MTETNKTRNYCYGCCIYIEYTCSFTIPNEIEECPCRMCLIKMVCRIACEEHETFFKNRIGYVP